MKPIAMGNSSSKLGATLIELLIVMAILGIIMGAITSYLSQSSAATRQQQNKSELQDRVRSVVQMLTQDLGQTGSSRYAISDNNNTAPLEESCPVEECLLAVNSSTRDKVKVKYVSSLSTESQACHQVLYVFDSGSFTLERLDVADSNCSATVDETLALALADNILAFDLRYLCSNGNMISTYPNSTSCPADGTAYPRSALFTVIGRSAKPVPGTAAKYYSTISGRSVTCPADYTCYALNQEVQMPNLKDR
jgi:prepilin-type N-terminal cleavage/methylation domain-containing protein